MKTNSGIQVKQIAEAAGVSSSTVSMVLNNRAGEFRIAESTIERILQAADELGYRHAPRNKSKKRNHHKSLLCAFCPTNFEKGPIAQYYAGIQRYWSEQDVTYETVLFPFELGRLKDKASWLSSEFIAGALLMALTEEDIGFIENHKFDIPIILINRTAKGYCSVLTDDYAVGDSAMAHFIKRGHRSFGIVSPNYSSRALSLRSTGYRDRFNVFRSENGDVFFAPVTYGDDSDEGGYIAMNALLDSGSIPTSVFIPSDNMISGAMRSIHEHRLDCPEEIEVISYGNKAVNSIVQPGVTSFAPPSAEMSYRSAELLHRFMKEGRWVDNVKLSFEAQCVYRDSSPERGTIRRENGSGQGSREETS
ncbi:LacI family DNA-binding transcriptional regulator [Cohnella fermenti]|nr:LacI family DNA-binding transcriptional regulator [Cohnella fermenti]